MRILISGATGFIGSYLTRLLVHKSHEVMILTSSESSLWRIDDILNKVTILKSDYSSLTDQEGKLCHFKPDLFFHLGWSGVSNDLRNDLSQIYSNIKTTVDLLSMTSKAGCKKWIILGSQAEYGPINSLVQETAVCAPTTLYGTVKFSTYLIASQLSKILETKLAWIRVFSTYGPKDHAHWMIPGLIHQILKKQSPILTRGEQQWDYLYVEDAAEAICQLGLDTHIEGLFNLGSGETHTIREVVEKVRDFIDPNFSLHFGGLSYRPDQVMHLQADISKLKSTIHWAPKTPLLEGLIKTVEWYKEN